MIPRGQVHRCPGCEQDRHVSHFVADSDFCALCRELGRQVPERAESGESRAASEKKGTMGEMVKCEECGREMKARGLAIHMTLKHGKRAKSMGGGRRPRGNRQSQIANRKSHISPGCLFCGGANQALAKDLVVEAIRGGMALDPAVALVRRLLAATR